MSLPPIRLDSRPETLIAQARWLHAGRPDDTAIILVEGDHETRITCRAFFDSAARYAAALEAAGARPGDVVVLVLQHGAPLLYSFWGALLLGAIPSIFPFLSDKLNPDRYFDSVRQLVVHARARLVVAYADFEPALRPHLAGTGAALLDANHLPLAGDAAAYLHRNPASAGDTAFLQHSSGSTGLQKGVMLSHRAVVSQLAAYSAALRLTADDVIVSWLPLYHDMGLIAGFVMPIMQGIPLVLMSPFQWVRDPKILLHAIHRHRATLCWLPNFAYNFMALQIRPAALEGVDLSSLRAVINCSEPVYADSHAVFLERFSRCGLRPGALATCYAMAENTFAVTQAGIDAPLTLDPINRHALSEDRRAVPETDDAQTVTMVSCGQPIPNCEIRVVDDQRQPLPERCIGEIALRSDSMLSGYYHRPDLTAEALAGGWYYTGDMGYIAGGELYVTGRKKDLIIVGGKNIYPQDIEYLVNAIPGVHPGRVVAFGVFNERLGTEDVAVIAEVETDDPAARAQIERDIRARIAQSAEVTARYVHLVEARWLIKTSSGKIARRANRDKFLTTVLNITS